MPKGGGWYHYKEWRESVDGIARVFPFPGFFPGTIDVYVEAETSINPEGFPTAQLLQDVSSYINETDPSTGLAIRRPANAAVRVLGITRSPLNVGTTGLQVPENVATAKEHIKAALRNTS